MKKRNTGTAAGAQVGVEIPRSVAIVGRPNVGKSRLFNRLLARRVAIVHDTAGVTRDLLVERVPDFPAGTTGDASASTTGGGYLLMDTGGIGLFTAATPDAIAAAVEEQVFFAINAASVVLFVVDVTAGCLPLDLEIAERLRRFGKRVILVANKADNEARAANQADFFALKLGPPVLVSAEHGTGVPFLIGKIKEALGEGQGSGEEVQVTAGVHSPLPVVRLCLAGRPNVGKSSIGNRLLGLSRLIVSDVAGTTRDPVRDTIEHTAGDGSRTRFEITDTAGRRAPNSRDTLDFLSTLRADNALARADVVLLVLDAATGVTRLDKRLAGDIARSGAGLIIVVNKWDIARARFAAGAGGVGDCEREDEFRARYLKAVRSELFFLPNAPVVFVSARDGFDAAGLLDAAAAVRARAAAALPTGKLNRVVADLMERRPPSMVSGKRLKCYYAVHVGGRPPTVRLFCNSEERVETAYERYLLAGIRDAFDLAGVPLALRFIGKPKDPKRGFFTRPAPLNED
ncbi:MAG: ribosome biogenesis GTPase Der [Puniceicoccales bacterium]|jgi:GTP-binding protein|nr:ribosome biogenesis GTPase Der [Puniceicoccales bacterium]